MALRLRLPFLSFAFAVAAASVVHAQEAVDPRDAPSARWEITPYIGGAVNSPSKHFIGVTPDRNHLFLGVHATVPIVRRKQWTLAYAPEVVPLLLVTGNPRPVEVTTPEGTGLFPGDPGPVAGFAVSPLGLEYQRRLGPRWQWFTAWAAGVVWFSRDVPIPFARAFNYTAEGGAGLQWRRSERTSLRFGYKLHHLSNNYTARENPGLDGHVFYAGVSLAVARPKGSH